MKPYLIPLTILISSANLLAQEKSSNIELTAISFQIGVQNTSIQYDNSIENFKKLAPNSVLLDNDLSTFENNVGTFYQSSGPSFIANAHLTNKNKENIKRFNPEFRIGFSFSQNDLLNQNYNREELFRIDTLTSNQNGEEFYVDSIIRENYFVHYTQRQVYLNASYIIGSGNEKRWRFYGGLGIAMGVSFNASTHVNYYRNFSYETSPTVNLNNTPNDSNYETETNANKAGLTAAFSIPIGLNFRLSTEKEGLKNYSVFIELNPSIAYYSVPELDPIYTTLFTSSAGLRYAFD